MGKKQKLEKHQLPLHHSTTTTAATTTNTLVPRVTCLSRIEINLKCVVVLIFGISVLLSSVFWFFPHRPVSKLLRYDAKEEIKIKASVQARFRLEKPVTELVTDIKRLEYDIFSEIGVPTTKVAILSMRQAVTFNWTEVVFGILSDPIDATIKPVYLSLVRSSLIDVFLQQSNLTLTSTIFGQPYSFQIAKFPGGIAVNPEETAFLSQMSQNFVNFVLNNSICYIKGHVVLLKGQMKLWLHLRPYENVFVQVTNKKGSTTEGLVTVHAGVISDMGLVLPQRLRQLAQIITNSSPSTNLGLNNTVFGKVKEISLSSFLNQTRSAAQPTTSPAPAPGPSPPHQTPCPPSTERSLPHYGSEIAPSQSPSSNTGVTVGL